MFTSMRIPQENRLQLLEETKFKSKKEEYSSLVKLHLKLEELATVSSKISRLMNRRASVIALRSKLDDKNPNRFKIPGRLIKEERIRNKVANLPKLTEQIKRLVGEFESVCGQDFLWKGKPLREIILEFERAEREAQERERVELEQRRIRRKSGGFKAAFGTPLKKRALKRPQSASVLKIHSKLRKNNDYKKIEKSVETKKHLKQISNTPISLS
ncbi:hypothetical protein MHBO_000060 [Bonamia ostreae]|uniref:Uncharacterized protein n=1 Tax=Bonamia ostreae TaxID=126728 RepID=A0ABV2AEB1_9EUKA